MEKNIEMKYTHWRKEGGVVVTKRNISFVLHEDLRSYCHQSLVVYVVSVMKRHNRSHENTMRKHEK